MPSCHPAASVSVTTVGMIRTIFGMRRVVISMRAGIERLPRIGPRTRPRNRSMIVHAAPPATCRNSTGHSLSDAIAQMRKANAIATTTRPFRGTISKSSASGCGGAAGRSRAMSATAGGYPPARLSLVAREHRDHLVLEALRADRADAVLEQGERDRVAGQIEAVPAQG